MFKLKHIFCGAEGLDTSTFFGDQGNVDESTLPDAGSDESLAMQPPPKDASDGKDPVDADQDPAAVDDPSQPKSVPLGALQEERNRRKQVEDRSRELETQNATLLERMTKILEMQAAPKQEQPQAPQIPDFIDDPVGHLEGIKAQFRQELEQMRQLLGGVNQHQQQQIQYNQLVTAANAQEAAFREVTPDYDAALLHLRDTKMAEYMAAGLEQGQAAEMVGRDGLVVIQNAVANGKNPAEVMYNIAKALRYAPPPPTGGDNGGNPPPAAPPKVPPTSLSTVPAAGRAPDEKGRLTAKDIASMPQEDFDKLFESMRDNVQRPAF